MTQRRASTTVKWRPVVPCNIPKVNVTRNPKAKCLIDVLPLFHVDCITYLNFFFLPVVTQNERWPFWGNYYYIVWHANDALYKFWRWWKYLMNVIRKQNKPFVMIFFSSIFWLIVCKKKKEVSINNSTVRFPTMIVISYSFKHKFFFLYYPLDYAAI